MTAVHETGKFMINGIINVYKEKGYTSFDVVAKLRGILKTKKIGHTGTLDPDAEGVLPVCLGKATKVCDLLTDKNKEYVAVMLLGKVTDTQDTTGTVLEEHLVEVTEEQVKEAVLSFTGEYMQVPPMYSALKVNGKKLCDLARAGVTVERQARPVQLYSIEIIKMELPRVCMRVRCSKGTYIRTLCQDIGEKLSVEHVWNPCCAQRYLNFVYRMRFASPRSKNVYKKRQDRHRQNSGTQRCLILFMRLIPYFYSIKKR